MHLQTGGTDVKQINVYELTEIKNMLLTHMASEYSLYISEALFEWSLYERFVHINVDKLEKISTEYHEDGSRSTNDGHVPNKVQKWIEVVNELILLIEDGYLPEEFIIDYDSDLSLFK